MYGLNSVRHIAHQLTGHPRETQRSSRAQEVCVLIRVSLGHSKLFCVDPKKGHRARSAKEHKSVIGSEHKAQLASRRYEKAEFSEVTEKLKYAEFKEWTGEMTATLTRKGMRRSREDKKFEVLKLGAVAGASIPHGKLVKSELNEQGQLELKIGS